MINGQDHVDKVLGDIYELDLSLPEAKGINTVLFVSPTTPVWEANHYQHHPNGSAVENLADLTRVALRK